MSTVKEDGENIFNWSIEELKAIVRDFQEINDCKVQGTTSVEYSQRINDLFDLPQPVIAQKDIIGNTAKNGGEIVQDVEVLASNKTDQMEEIELEQGLETETGQINEDLGVFSQKPVIKVENFKFIKKGFFSKQRVFKIVTNPGNHSVQRCREDLKWLVHNLKSEFPKSFILDVHVGTLSKKVIEEFFEGLLPRIPAQESRILRFFLTAEDNQFENRRTRVSASPQIINMLLTPLLGL